jgi:hypothetical protein
MKQAVKIRTERKKENKFIMGKEIETMAEMIQQQE